MPRPRRGRGRLAIGYALGTAFEDDEESATILRGRTLVPAPPDIPVPPRAAPAARPAPAPAPAPPRTPAAAEPRRGRDLGATLDEAVFVPSADAPSGAAGDLLWRSFLDGAGIEPSAANAPTPERLRAVGEMVKIAVGGIQSLVSMRARVKSEMQAEMTMIKVRDNNPLKFAPDAALALQMLLQPPARGFMDGPDALRAALSDLQAHQVGMTAGLRSVLDTVLGRLDPAKLEAQAAKPSLLGGLVPGQRKALLWDLYFAQYHALREEALDNSQRLFGAAFRDGYEAQVRSLGASPDQTGPSGPPRRGRST